MGSGWPVSQTQIQCDETSCMFLELFSFLRSEQCEENESICSNFNFSKAESRLLSILQAKDWVQVPQTRNGFVSVQTPLLCKPRQLVTHQESSILSNVQWTKQSAHYGRKKKTSLQQYTTDPFSIQKQGLFQSPVFIEREACRGIHCE